MPVFSPSFNKRSSVMRSLFFCLGCCLYAAVGFGQSDTMRQTPPTVSPTVMPSNSAPMTSPAAVPQLQPNKAMPAKKGRRRLKTVPPSDPNAFGVGVTIEGEKKPKKNGNNP
jgi:hypothetical protein